MRYLPALVFMIIGLLAFHGCGTVGQNIDMAKGDKIVNGSTTKQEVKSLLGPPFKKGIQNGDEVWVYEYNRYKLLGKDLSKNIIVVFDETGVVKSHQSMTNKPAD